MSIRQPIVVVLGHVDHGKTTLLDKIRGTTVAAREPGAISQHIGASFVPDTVLKRVCKDLLDILKFKLEIPGLLFIDTPGHAAFSNLRKRGGSVADIAILVIDISEGIKPQTVESIEILKSRKTPFVIAANKLDNIPGWRSKPDKPFLETMKKTDPSTLRIIDDKIYRIVGALSEYNISSERLDRVRDFTKTVAIVPVSSKTGEGIPDLLAMLAGLTQQYMKKQLTINLGKAKGTVLEVKEDPGIGPNINAIIYDGVLHKNDLIALGGKQGPFTTKIRAILVPKPLDEIKDPREKFRELKKVNAAAGIKIVAPNLDETLAGSSLYTVIEGSMEEYLNIIKSEIESIKILTDKLGIILKTDTLGSLEALVNELKNSNIPIRIADIGDVSKRDVIEASVVKSEKEELGIILAFNVKVLPDAEEEAIKSIVKIFRNNVIYQLIDDYHNWLKELEETVTQKTFESLVKPGKIKLLRGLVFRRNNPAIVGVEVLAGRIATNYHVIRQDGTSVGKIVQLQDKKETIPEADKGMQVAISMKEPTIGRQVRENDILYVDVPEKHLTTLNDFKDRLTIDDLQCIEEFIQIKRKTAPYFAFGI